MYRQSVVTMRGRPPRLVDSIDDAKDAVTLVVAAEGPGDHGVVVAVVDLAHRLRRATELVLAYLIC